MHVIVSDRIVAAMDRLSPSERRVAEIVTADPRATMEGTVAMLARAAGVSEPTVVRFCRSLGLEGFGELRLALARQEGQQPHLHRRIHGNMRPMSAAAAVFDGAMAALAEARDSLDGEAIEKAALALIRAERVEIWGFGASATVAADLAHKLFRVCRGVVARDDPHMQAMAAATMDEESVALCVSHTGRTRAIITSARQARLSGATVIALTAPDSPLAEEATLLLSARVEEDTELYTPMVSRLVHLTLGDALAVAIGLLSPPVASVRLGRIKAALKPLKIEKGTGEG
ncbi:SIS domain-containing protein [Acetobacteraceae bacterium H6797]|nr:SIS domain-containing protein [Acetobacteraceae bacterium H6797]